MALVLDTGPVLALLDANDEHHERCVRMVDEVDEPLVVAVTVLVEVDYWVRTRLDVAVWQVFVEDIADGAYRLAALDEADLMRAAALEAQYADLGIGLVDASVCRGGFQREGMSVGRRAGLTREELDRIGAGDVTLFETAGRTPGAQSGEEYRKTLERALDDADLATRVTALPWGSGSVFAREGARPAFVFCIRVGDHRSRCSAPWCTTRTARPTRQWGTL